ncbi:hypothetical protein ACOYR1_03955 [Thalassotalea piscium]
MQMIQNKTSVVITIIFALWLLLDDVDRIMSDNNRQTHSNAQQSITPLILPQANKATLDALKNKYAQYAEATKVKKPKIVSAPKKSAAEIAREKAAREANQKGRLKAVFAGDNILRLKAIIENDIGQKDTFTALIELKNEKTKKTNIDQFNVNSEISGFTIIKIENTEVFMRRTVGDKVQDLILVMYKS